MARCEFVFLALLSVIESSLLLTTKIQHQTKSSKSYKVIQNNSTCSTEELKITLELNRNFHGVVYAKGFPLEKNCRSSGTNESFVEIKLSTSGCGVRLVTLDDDALSYVVTLSVQMDKFLQQINDVEVTSSCVLSPKDMIHPRRFNHGQRNNRTGRNRIYGPENEEILNEITSWMEIEGTSDTNNMNKVSVGEQTIILIKTMLPDEYSISVADCYAHDGTGDVTQKLLDERGCPLDESIMSSLEVIEDENSSKNEIAWEAGEEPEKKNDSKTNHSKSGIRKSTNVEIIPESQAIDSKMNLRVIGTMFSAFKFPDTANLHLKCTLLICKEFCPPVSCDRDLEDDKDRSGKSLKRKEPGDVIDKIEVFNSVEVVAPGIDSDGFSSDEDLTDPKTSSTDNIFCLSASKMAFSFAILGAIFLCGVLAALWTVMRNHMRKVNKSFDGSEQILVVRDSPMNLTNPRNKPFNNWTYSRS